MIVGKIHSDTAAWTLMVPELAGVADGNLSCGTAKGIESSKENEATFANDWMHLLEHCYHDAPIEVVLQHEFSRFRT